MATTYHPPTAPDVLVTIHVEDSPVTWTPEKIIARVPAERRAFYEAYPEVTEALSLLMNLSTAGKLRVRAEQPHKAIQQAMPRRKRQSREASREAVAATLEQHPKWGRRKIAQAVGLSESYVGDLLRELRGAATLAATDNLNG